MTKVKLTILGCGNSAGVPEIGNYWGACDPNEPRNRRTRPSIALQDGTSTVIVDTGPDFCLQLNRENISAVDAVFYTHAHADHIAGMDELRALYKRNGREIIPVYGDSDTISELQDRFTYMFQDTDSGLYPAVCAGHVIGNASLGKMGRFGTIPAIPFAQNHGNRQSLGLRVGDIAYSTDMAYLTDETIETLQGIKTWIVDGAGYNAEKFFVHATLDQVYRLNERIGAEQVFITHMPPFMDYQTVCDELPNGYAPAYDGLVLETDV